MSGAAPDIGGPLGAIERLAPAARTALRLLSPGGRRGLSILVYHRLLPARDALFPGEMGCADFERQVRLVQTCFNLMPLIDAVRHARAGTLPPRAACITFDDGYADNAELGLPILHRLGAPATFFVSSGFLDGGRMWNDTLVELVRGAPGLVFDAAAIGLGQFALATLEQRRQTIATLIGHLKYLPMEQRLDYVNRLAADCGRWLPDQLMMSTAQVRQLHAAGMDIGAHTVNHPILAAMPAAAAQAEIAAGKRALEDIIGAPVPLFAYPNGKPGVDYGAEHVAMVRTLGFEGAVSTAWGASTQPDDVFQLPRFTPWDRTPLRFVLRLARNLTQPAARV